MRGLAWRQHAGGRPDAARCDATDRDLHLFDTFEGMPPPTERDRRPDGKPAAELLSTRPRRATYGRSPACDDVEAGMAETGYPPARVHFHVGPVEETMPAQAPDRSRSCAWTPTGTSRRGTNSYTSSTALSPGGVLIIDDYGFWQGARQAIDEFLEHRGARVLLLPVASGRVAVKP